MVALLPLRGNWEYPEETKGTEGIGDPLLLGKVGRRANNSTLEKKTLLTKRKDEPRIQDGCNTRRPKKRPKDMNMIMTTWNIMRQVGKMQQIANELMKHKVDIATIQEMRWKGAGRVEKRGYSIMYSGDEDNRGLHGVGFFVNSKARKAVL